jgi:DNA-binding NarL/FixJ family response regulator
MADLVLGIPKYARSPAILPTIYAVTALEVLRLIAGGNANKEIAAQLSIGEDTVKRHVTNILSKLHANDRTHAVTIGLKRGIIEL